MEQEQKSIILFNSEKKWGGGERWYADVADMLYHEGFKVYLCGHPKGQLYARVLHADYHIIPIKISNVSFLNPIKYIRLFVLFRKIKAYAIIINLPSDLKLAGPVSKKAGIKNRIYRRGSARAINPSLLNKWIFRKIITKIIANSKKTADTILQKEPTLFPREHIHVIYNGIHIPEITVKNKQNRKLIMGTAGRLSPEKGYDRLLRIASLLKESGEDFELHIAGEGKIKSQLEEQITHLKLEKVVKLVGFVEDMDSFFRDLDIFVLSSYYEGFGYVLIEAMARMLPCIAFDIGTTREIISHEETGFIIENDKLESFAAHMVLLMRDKAKRELFGKQGYERAKASFSITRMKKQLIKVIS